MGSTRLPGKVAMDVGGEPMLVRVIRRARAFRGVDEVVVATSTLPPDQTVADIAASVEAPCVRGAENDVLARFHKAASAHQADAIVRVTADCPLLDPEVSSRVIETFRRQRPDYASNMVMRTFPRGLDTEVISWKALDLSHREATHPADREHVTIFVRRQPDRFQHVHVTNDVDLSAFRWTVDTPQDLELIRRIYEVLGEKPFGFREVLRVLEDNPGWSRLNQHIEQKKVDLFRAEGLS